MTDAEGTDMLPEYDLEALGEPEQSRYSRRYWESRQLRVLDPDLVERFQDSKAVNEALREYIELKKRRPGAGM